MRYMLLAALPGLGSLIHGHVHHPALPPTAEIFVLNHSGSIMAYAPGRNGNVAPDWLVGLQLTPAGIARDPLGRIYVTNNWIHSISVFAPGAKGPASPVATIRGSNTRLYF